MSDVKVVVTNKGMSLLVQAMAGVRPLKLTGIQLGNGDKPEDLLEVEALSNPVLDLPIYSSERGDNFLRLTTHFNNDDVTCGDFILTEVGVWAEDDEEGRILYAYAYQDDSEDLILGDGSSKWLETTMSVHLLVSNSADITVSMKSELWASKEDFETHLKDYQNPHKVTAAQVGLENVENCKTQDAVVEFEDAAADDDNYPTSGDVLSLMMARIVKKLTALFDHTKDQANPHKVTLDQVGAAAKKHQHSASDMTTGVLGVARGGTGKGSWTANRLLYASAAGTLSQIAHPTEKAFLLQDATGAPYFGTLSTFEIYHVGTTTPPRTNMLWIDTTPQTGGTKFYNPTTEAWEGLPVRYAEN